MANQPICRYEVQYAFGGGGGGGYLRWNSPGKEHAIDPATLVRQLREMADTIENVEAKRLQPASPTASAKGK